jgi:hypothetical protein
MKACTLVRALLLTLSLSATSAFARMDQEPTPAPAKLTPEQILSGIYQPWTGPIAEMGKALRPDRNYIVWVHVPAQHPMDLRSAEMFRRWALATPVTELTISHNMVAFRCKNRDGQFVTGATGMTGASNLQDAKALIAGYGVSIFFATYTDGHLNPESEVDGYVTKNLAKRGVVFGAFEVTEDQCDAMQGFLSDFVHHPNRPFERFSNVGDPEKFEGGGCVTFASALMKKAGILDTVIPSFFRDFYVARYLMGGNLKPQADVEPPATPWLKGKRRSISFNLFWSNPWDSAPTDFPGYEHLRQIDPEKMVYTLKQFAGAYLAGERNAGLRTAAAKKLAASPLGTRVVVDANNLADPPNLEFTNIPIDDSFDDEMAHVGALARGWFRAKAAEGFHVRMAQAVGMPVLLLEKP